MSIPEQPFGSRPNADESIPVHDPGEPRGEMPVSPETAAEPEPVQTQVVVRRSPRYNHFMILGAIVGALVALILTFAFPANPTYDRGQVFGYLLLVGVAIGVGLGALVALILDRIVGRKGTSVIADWVETTPGDETGTRKDGDA
ncbi:MFS transporter [Cryobacterium tepidiphilum]|uniref:MFS transporter n=1 Tax=Cryobacterium tepidiphilum TaxID=2486026 RepID=UPI0011CD57ED|nr:MFS transporter [Cryobacterium tepidiphilum]